MQIAKNWRSPMGIYLENLERDQIDNVASFKENTISKIRTSNSTRRMTYLELNADLSIHPIYNSEQIPENCRISFTRMRLSSHYLKIETGRWSRIPRENRLCECGQVQSEIHVLLTCPLLHNLRLIFHELNFDNINELMKSDNIIALAKYIHAVLKQTNPI